MAEYSSSEWLDPIERNRVVRLSSCPVVRLSLSLYTPTSEEKEPVSVEAQVYIQTCCAPVLLLLLTVVHSHRFVSGRSRRKKRGRTIAHVSSAPRRINLPTRTESMAHPISMPPPSPSSHLTRGPGSSKTNQYLRSNVEAAILHAIIPRP